MTTLNLNWHLSENCPYLSIQHCGHVQHKHRTVNTQTMCHISSQNPHTSDHIHHYVTLRHFQDGLKTLIQFTFYVCTNKRSSALITNEQADSPFWNSGNILYSKSKLCTKHAHAVRLCNAPSFLLLAANQNSLYHKPPRRISRSHIHCSTFSGATNGPSEQRPRLQQTRQRAAPSPTVT